MKKVISALMIAGMFAVVACGPSAEEKAAKEKAYNDSIALVEQQRIQDSIDAAAKAQAAADSARIADSLAKIKK